MTAIVEKFDGGFRIVGKNRSNIGGGRFENAVQAQIAADAYNGVVKDVREPEAEVKTEAKTTGSKPKATVGKSTSKRKDTAAKSKTSKSS